MYIINPNVYIHGQCLQAGTQVGALADIETRTGNLGRPWSMSDVWVGNYRLSCLSDCSAVTAEVKLFLG